MSASKKNWYRQCKMVSPTEGGHMVHTAWIPEKFAVKGRAIYFGKKTSTPDRVWTVESAPEHRISQTYLLDHERDYKTQRRASDI